MTHTVLVVEDEEDLRETMREVLELHGYTVVAASDGQEAVEQLGGIERVCLVLLDLVMPRMNGWDFFDYLQAQPAYAEIPVIVHTSAPSRAPAGVRRVLKKPADLDRLLSTVRDFCAP